MDSVLAFIVGVVIVVIGLAVSIALHEVGHLVPAKKFGVKVTQYMIGFGPTLWSKRRGETEYGVKAIPLGGYISMIGMFPPAKGERVHEDSTGFFRGLQNEPETGRRGFIRDLQDDARSASAETITTGDEHRAFYLLPVWKRVIIMLGGPAMNLLLAILLYGVLLMGFGLPQPSTTIGSVSECALPATSERQACEPDDPSAPGAAAGIQPGDRIVSIDGTPIDSWTESTAIIRDHPNQAVELIVERDGAEVELAVTPMLSERYVIDDEGQIVPGPDGEPATIDVGFVGIGSASETVRQPASAVMPQLGENIAGVLGIIIHLPQRVIDVVNAAFGPEERDPNGPISVVGVGRVAGEIASLDDVPIASKAASLVGILASLNVALLVFNLIPLLPLDGGHVAGALWEGLRRSFAKLRGKPDPGPVDMAKLMPVTFVVVILLGSLSALLIYADIVKPVQIF